jgi:FtsP/CotA-like multicopper oxidase with cupredoxin domain
MRHTKTVGARLFSVPALLAASSLLYLGATNAAQTPQIPLPGKNIPQFMQPLPTLSIAPQNSSIATLLGNQPLTIRMCEFDANVLPPGAIVPGVQTPTRVWGYIAGNTCPSTVQDTYIGPVIVNQRGAPTPITWVNELGNAGTTGVLAYKYSTDQTLHWADPVNMGMNNCSMMGGMPMFGSECAQNYSGPVPGVAHLHGGEVPPQLDGGPEAWFTSDGMYQGRGYYSLGLPGNNAIYTYPNTQEAGPLWFHDHTLGATRLNVYAGMAGAYFIQDPALALPSNLQPLTEVVPVVLQDRMFDTNGQLFFPADTAANMVWSPNPDHPYWVPEFVGDTIVVNGKAWPYLNVQPKRYRFLFLNGSNARTYEVSLTNQATSKAGPVIWVIGTDGGYLDAPVKIDPALQQKLVMMPGERYEVIIDFSGFAGTTLLVNNTGRTPYPRGAPPQGATLAKIMQFRVATGTVADNSYNPAAKNAAPLRSGSQKIVRLTNPAKGTLATGVTVQKTRQLSLNEVMGMAMTTTDPVTGLVTNYPGGPLEVLVNNTKWAGTDRPDFTPITVNGVTNYFSELPKEGDTEIWEIVNLTADAHPIHLHLVQFQLLNRQNYNTNNYMAAYNAAFAGGAFIPSMGPPLDYRTANNLQSGGKDGGNPDITPYLQGPVQVPAANEAGWKDTVIMFPGQVTRIAVRWAPTDIPVTAGADKLFYPFDPSDNFQYGYVWHCHIIDHEDNEMMRPDVVQPNPAAPLIRPLQKGIHY